MPEAGRYTYSPEVRERAALLRIDLLRLAEWEGNWLMSDLPDMQTVLRRAMDSVEFMVDNS